VVIDDAGAANCSFSLITRASVRRDEAAQVRDVRVDGPEGRLRKKPRGIGIVERTGGDSLESVVEHWIRPMTERLRPGGEGHGGGQSKHGRARRGPECAIGSKH
jgi:hypothetical protein